MQSNVKLVVSTRKARPSPVPLQVWNNYAKTLSACTFSLTNAMVASKRNFQNQLTLLQGLLIRVRKYM